MPDTPDLVAAVEDMAEAFRSMEAATENLAATHAEDLSSRRSLRWFSALVLVVVAAVAVVAISTAIQVRDRMREREVAQCVASLEFRANLHAGIDAVVADLVDHLDGDPSVVAVAKEAIRRQVPAEPPCLKSLGGRVPS